MGAYTLREVEGVVCHSFYNLSFLENRVIMWWTARYHSRYRCYRMYSPCRGDAPSILQLIT